MRLISLVSCIFLILITTAYASEEIIKCIDADGNTIFTSSPQDGMNCLVEKKEESPKTKVNLMAYCAELNNLLEEIKEKREDINKQLSKLQKELEGIRDEFYRNPEEYEFQSRQAQPVLSRMSDLEDQNSSLNKRQREYEDEKSNYKCNQMYYDMSNMQSQINRNSSSSSYRK